MLDRLIGPDDVFAVMTPRNVGDRLTFPRKTTTIEGELQRYRYWGQKDMMVKTDREDEAILSCYGPSDRNPLSGELIARRHEKLTVDALTDLARYLRGVREERKAVIAVTSGWVLYQPNERLLQRVARRERHPSAKSALVPTAA